MNPGTNATDVNGIRKDQLESAARARAQRDGMDPATANNVTIEYLSANPAAYLGQTVSVRGKVEVMYQNKPVFIIDSIYPSAL